MRTKFDDLADRAKIIDRVTFIKNIEILCNYDSTYKTIFEPIIKLNNTVDVIDTGLNFNDWELAMKNKYWFGQTQIMALSNIFNTEMNTNINIEITAVEQMFKDCYEVYKSNYEYFIQKIKQLSDSRELISWIPNITKKSCINEHNIPSQIPSVPEIPKN